MDQEKRLSVSCSFIMNISKTPAIAKRFGIFQNVFAGSAMEAAAPEPRINIVKSLFLLLIQYVPPDFCGAFWSLAHRIPPVSSIIIQAFYEYNGYFMSNCERCFFSIYVLFGC